MFNQIKQVSIAIVVNLKVEQYILDKQQIIPITYKVIRLFIVAILRLCYC